MGGFVERNPTSGRPNVRPDAMIMLSLRARTSPSWQSSVTIGNLDKGVLALLSYFPVEQWVPVRQIVVRVDEHEVEILAAVSRMFALGLVDIEGVTVSRTIGAAVVTETEKPNTGG